MSKPTLAVISTWQELCGIAHYSAFLVEALSKHFDVTVLPAHRSVLPTRDPAADIRAQEIIAQAAGYDHVNIQYEPSIYGPDAATVHRRIGDIVRVAKSVTLTLHYMPRPEPPITPTGLISHLLRGAVFTGLRRWRNERRAVREWDAFFKVLEAKAAEGKLGVIAHNPSDAAYMRQRVPSARIVETPLVYLDEAARHDLDHKAAHSRLHRILPKPKSAGTRYLGVFGFYSVYKGFETAIEALQFLPDDYELLMFSSLHWSTVPKHIPNDPYLRKLVDLVADRKLASRVHFLGSQSDDDLLIGMMLCDAVLLPYLNSDHAASGPMGQALDLSRRVLATRNRQFGVVEHYRGQIFEYCDLGNPIEYAQKIGWVTAGRTDRDVHGLRFVDYPPIIQRHTPQTTAAAYARAAGVSADPSSSQSPLLAAE
jgi:glycosyltransferase involved in cell wall biosynthesis